jgi:DNA polymerase-3 subunit epsilon
MRQVVLDTETTGLECAQGHRIIEIGCVELFSRRATGRHFHRYLNPGREVDEAARAIHGLSLRDLSDKPRFADIAAELTEFIAGAELIIHNAGFDVGFLDAEFARIEGAAPVRIGLICQVLDTLSLARDRHPGQRNNLDALCKRYGIDNSHRELHGALLDARILADVYLAMTGGQSALALEEGPRRFANRRTIGEALPVELVLCIVTPTPEERIAHEQLQELLHAESHGHCLWRGQ